MSVTNPVNGPRLEFVTRKVVGDVQMLKTKVTKIKGKDGARDKHTFTTAPVAVKEDVFMVYTPQGQCYRLTYDQMVKRGFDRKPTILNFEAVKDASSPAGQFKFAINDEERQKAWRLMEDQIVKLCQRRRGKSERSDEELERNESAA